VSCPLAVDCTEAIFERSPIAPSYCILWMNQLP
jgi:hypothetical protein